MAWSAKSIAFFRVWRAQIFSARIRVASSIAVYWGRFTRRPSGITREGNLTSVLTWWLGNCFSYRRVGMPRTRRQCQIS